MKHFVVVLMFVFIAGIKTNAQTCLHKNLSKIFNYEVLATHIKNRPSTVDSADIIILIREKKTGKLRQKLAFGVNHIFEDVFENCGNSRSYITGYHENNEVLDYDFGDLIVADLNFDGREDFAIKNDSGGNGGPVYNFYLQNNTGQFHLSNYLTKFVRSFPQEIAPFNKTITTQIHANVHQEGRTTFKYNSKTKRWSFRKSELVEAR